MPSLASWVIVTDAINGAITPSRRFLVTNADRHRRDSLDSTRLDSTRLTPPFIYLHIGLSLGVSLISLTGLDLEI